MSQLEPRPPFEVINTIDQVKELVDKIAVLPSVPTLYVDLQGVNPARDGSVSILTILVETGVVLVDVHVLGAQAFDTPGEKGKTLKDILQDANITKVFFDVRNASDALFAHFSVSLKGVEDIQLMENATMRTTPERERLSSLGGCIYRYLSLGPRELARFRSTSSGATKVFEKINERPMRQSVINYCSGDVQHLPKLREKLWTTRTATWKELVKAESAKRVETSQKADYQPHHPDKWLATWTAEQNKTLDTLNG